jgi:hypothetical protein
MKDFTGYEDLIKKIGEARRIARDHAPRGSNDDLEAGLFLASCLAMQDYTQERAREQYTVDQSQSAAPSVAEPSEETALRGEGPEPHTDGGLDELAGADQALSEDDTDPEDDPDTGDDKPPRRRGRK